MKFNAGSDYPRLTWYVGRDFIFTDLCHHFRRRLMSSATSMWNEKHTSASSFSGKCAMRKWAFEDAYPRIQATNVCDSRNPYRGLCRRWVILILESLHSFRIVLASFPWNSAMIMANYDTIMIKVKYWKIMVKIY